MSRRAALGNFLTLAWLDKDNQLLTYHCLLALIMSCNVLAKSWLQSEQYRVVASRIAQLLQSHVTHTKDMHQGALRCLTERACGIIFILPQLEQVRSWEAVDVGIKSM